MPRKAPQQHSLFSDQPHFEQIYQFSHLYQAYRLARASKRYRSGVAEFSLELERNLQDLATELRIGSYQPGAYRTFTIYEHKPRRISAAPFRDRVVHHALMLLIEPLIERRLQPFCYACRKGKGVHAAVNAYQRIARQSRYVLKIDVRKYFPSIDKLRLVSTVFDLIDDLRLRRLVKQIIESTDSPKGLPIGNLTSQSFANVYLAAVDDWLANQLSVVGVVRYVDDYFIFGRDLPALWLLLSDLERLFKRERLALRGNLSQVFPVSRKVPVLGYQISVTRRWLKSDNGKCAAKRFRALAKQRRSGVLTFDQLRPKIHAWIGHARHGETSELRRSIFANIAC